MPFKFLLNLDSLETVSRKMSEFVSETLFIIVRTRFIQIKFTFTNT